MEQAHGNSSTSRERLSKLLREGGEVMTVDSAAHDHGLSDEDAAKDLACWRNQAVGRRVLAYNR